MVIYDVFISCKSEDYKYAEEIYDYLKDYGINAFLASRELRRLGESEYRRAISNALKESHHMIVFASNPEYIESTWVEYEWDMFVNAKLKGKKQGNILTILKDVPTDEIPMDLWKYESFTFDGYRQNLVKYVETPNSIERKKEIQRKEEEEEKKRKEEESKALRRAELKSKLEVTAAEYKKSVAALQVDIDKINTLLMELGITYRECPICHNSVSLDERSCDICGWMISPLEGLPELSYLNSDFEDSKQKYTSIFQEYLKINQYFDSTSELNLRNSELEIIIKNYTAKNQELEAEVTKQQKIIEELNQKIGKFNSSQDCPNTKLMKADYKVEPPCNCTDSTEEPHVESSIAFYPYLTMSDTETESYDEGHTVDTQVAETVSQEEESSKVSNLYSEASEKKASCVSSKIEIAEDKEIAAVSEPEFSSKFIREEESLEAEVFQPVWSEDCTVDQRQIITEILNNMVKVEGGRLILGATEEQLKWAKNNEKPAHLVELSSFWICKFPVIQREWEIIMNVILNKEWRKKIPAVNISLIDCREFVKKLKYLSGINFAIPTEAQWEFAARGGMKSEGYVYSGSNNLKEVGWFFGSSGSGLRKVGLLKPNELGLYDMSGNVYEWCDEKYGEYTGNFVKDPHNCYTKVSFWSSNNFIFRGGSYLSGKKYCRVSFRNNNWGEDYKSDGLGLRLVINS